MDYTICETNVKRSAYGSAAVYCLVMERRVINRVSFGDYVDLHNFHRGFAT